LWFKVSLIYEKILQINLIYYYFTQTKILSYFLKKSESKIFKHACQKVDTAQGGENKTLRACMAAPAKAARSFHRCVPVYIARSRASAGFTYRKLSAPLLYRGTKISSRGGRG
jgi:hypothetical protein